MNTFLKNYYVVRTYLKYEATYLYSIFLFLYFQKNLPLQIFHYGSMYSQEQHAAVEIGPLICEG